VRSSTIPFARGKTPASCIAPPGRRRSNSGLPAPSTTGTIVTATSSSSPASANWEATFAADDPQVAVAA
jgi:hypothetical protein